MSRQSESGRNILEMIAVIVLIILLIMVGLWGFRKAILTTQVNTITKDMSNAITERRYQIAQGGSTKKHTLDTKIGSTQMVVENIIDATEKDSFTVLLKDQSQQICEEIKKYNIFTPKKVEINNTVDGNCQKTNNILFYFDGTNNSSGNNKTDPLKGKCDGARCSECKKCNPNTGLCENDNTIKKGDCGICSGGFVVQKAGVSLEDCQKCDSSTNWKIVKDTKDEECYKCENGVKKTKTGEDCDLCGKCKADYTCDEEAGKQNYIYRIMENGVCTPKTEYVCPIDKTNSDCCIDNTHCGTCKKCSASYTCEPDEEQNGQHVKDDGKCCVNGDFAYDNTLCPEGKNICTFNGKNYAHNQVIEECGLCNNGTIESKTDACRDCNTSTYKWTWKEGKTNFTTCGSQCCEFGCSETDNTKCKCALGTQSFAHGTTVGDCGVCQNGEIKDKTDIELNQCQKCDESTNYLKAFRQEGYIVPCLYTCCPTGQQCNKAGTSCEDPDNICPAQKPTTIGSVCHYLAHENCCGISADGNQLTCVPDGEGATTGKCLGACGVVEEFGIALILDRSGSMQETFKTPEGEKKRYNMVDKALSVLKVYPDTTYTAVYVTDYAGGIKLSWGQHSLSAIKEAIYTYANAGNTGFSKAFNNIDNICKGTQKFVILWLTDGEINKDTATLKKILKNSTCEAKLYLVSPNSKDKTTYDADEWIDIKNFDEKAVRGFNNLVDEEMCIPNGKQAKPKTLGLRTCPAGQGYFKGKCNTCTGASSCDLEEYVCLSTYYHNGTSCKECPTNATCNGHNFTCNAGYKQNSCTGCIKCTACSGRTVSSAGDTSCTTCNNGWIPNDTHSACTICPAGSYQNFDVCKTCGDGRYSSAGATSCTVCNGGMINDEHTTCTPCTGATKSVSNHTACEACPVGQCANKGHTGCGKKNSIYTEC